MYISSEACARCSVMCARTWSAAVLCACAAAPGRTAEAIASVMPKAGERLPVSHVRPDAWHRPLAFDGSALVADSRYANTFYVARCKLRELKTRTPSCSTPLQRVGQIDSIWGSHIANGLCQSAVASH